MLDMRFRAWLIDQKIMVDVMAIDWHYESIHYARNEEDKTWAVLPETTLENSILLQYTGLKDKKPSRIFEGDIILDEGHTTKYFEVVWSDKGACFLKKQIHSEAPYYTRFDDRDEVIGNKWANPELLKK